MSKRFVNTAGCSFVLFLYNLSFAGSGKLLVAVIVTCPDSQSADRFIAVVSADIYFFHGFMKSIFFHDASEKEDCTNSTMYYDIVMHTCIKSGCCTSTC